MKYWLVATFKANQIRRVENNLMLQNFNYYLPKITTKKFNSSAKVEILFPGYIFIQSNIDDYAKIKYTKGINNVIKFGNNIPFIPNDEIESVRIIEKLSKSKPILSKIKVGQKAIVSRGSLVGAIVEISSLPNNKRVDILLSILGSLRKISIPVSDLSL